MGDSIMCEKSTFPVNDPDDGDGAMPEPGETGQLDNRSLSRFRLNLNKVPWDRSARLAAHFGTSLAAVIAIVAYYEGAVSNRRSAHAQTQAVAISLMQDYMKLSIEHREVVDRPDSLPVDAEYEWLAAHAYFTAESIYNLTRGQPTWDSTAASIVRYHRAFVRDGDFPCKDYSAEFVALVKRELRGMFKCWTPLSED